MKFFKSFDEFNNWNYEQCGLKLIDVFTKTGNNFVILDRISSSYYCSPKYFETDVNAKIYAKDNYVFQRVVIMLFDMEQYIASYKHLIGCEVEFNKHTHIFNGTYEFKYLFNLSPEFMLKKLKFYLDDETLGTYEEYVQLHYPEYEHVWKHQL